MLRQMQRSAVHLLAKRGKSQREIARELGLSRVTVVRALKEPVDKQPAKRDRASSVDPFLDQGNYSGVQSGNLWVACSFGRCGVG